MTACRYIELTEIEASMVLSNWACQPVLPEECLSRHRARAFVATLDRSGYWHPTSHGDDHEFVARLIRVRR